MTWLFGDSFDLYAALADMSNGYWDAGQSLPGAALVAGRFSGSQALAIVTGGSFIVKTSGANDAVHHFVFGFKQTTAISGSTLGAYLQLSDGATNQCCIVFRSDGAILLTSATPGGTVLATYTGAFPVTNTYYGFEIEVLISSTAGYMNVRKNGNTVNDFTSATNLNTRPGVNNYANKLTLGFSTNGPGHHVDDFLWRSDAATISWMGDLRCFARMPASDVSIQFARLGGATNFSQVSEAHQDGATSYVLDSIPGDADFYGIASIPSTPVTTIAVVTRGYMQKSDAGTRTGAVQLKSGATTVASPTLTLSSSAWAWIWRNDTTDPATGAAWTAAAVNNAQIGPTTVA